MLTGPESCGKTTLATALGKALQVPVVPETSRDYLNQKLSVHGGFRYSEKDLLAIAHEQQTLENKALKQQPELLVCDTDLLVIILWSEVRFGECHPHILDTFENVIAEGNRHYLLCDHDIPWHPDPLRESADDRPELYDLYQQKLEHYDLPYTVMTGNEQKRLAKALGEIQVGLNIH